MLISTLPLPSTTTPGPCGMGGYGVAQAWMLAPGGEACNQATQRGGQATDEHVRADRVAGQDRRQDVLDRIGDADGGFAHDQVPLYTSSNSCGKSFAQLSTY